MTVEEIRNTFGHNQVYGADSTEKLLVLALGEIAAQLAELNINSTKTRTVVNI
jgi:hypothetical protein